jgi:hypothetical protein
MPKRIIPPLDLDISKFPPLLGAEDIRASIIKVSDTGLQQMVAAGHITSVKLGRRRFFDVPSLIAHLNRCAASTKPPKLTIRKQKEVLA